MFGKMVVFITDNFCTDRWMEKENSIFLMEVFMMAIFKMIKKMEKDYIFGYFIYK